MKSVLNQGDLLVAGGKEVRCALYTAKRMQLICNVLLPSQIEVSIPQNSILTGGNADEALWPSR